MIRKSKDSSGAKGQQDTLTFTENNATNPIPSKKFRSPLQLPTSSTPYRENFNHFESDPLVQEYRRSFHYNPQGTYLDASLHERTTFPPDDLDKASRGRPSGIGRVGSRDGFAHPSTKNLRTVSTAFARREHIDLKNPVVESDDIMENHNECPSKINLAITTGTSTATATPFITTDSSTTSTFPSFTNSSSTITTANPCKERKMMKYSLKQLSKIEKDRGIFEREYSELTSGEVVDMNCEIEEEAITLTNNVLHQNQEKLGNQIFQSLCNKHVVMTMAIYWPQAGKTGAILHAVNLYVTKFDIPLEHIYVVTGASSRDWKRQTRDRFPPCIRENVFHQNDFLIDGGFASRVQNKKNVLIVIDEVHIASGIEQTIARAFKMAKLDKKAHLYEYDIKIVYIDATPDGSLLELNKDWGDAKQVIIGEAGPGYVGPEQLKEQGRLFQNKPVCEDPNAGVTSEQAKANVEELVEAIDNKWGNDFRYHIIRGHTHLSENARKRKKANDAMTPTNNNNNNGKEESKFSETRKSFEDATRGKNFVIIEYQSGSKFQLQNGNQTTSINEKLKEKPTCHTIIFVKELLRFGKTLEKEHLGVLYERYTTNKNYSAVIQGLLGRTNGYDCNEDLVVYTELEAVNNYIELYHCGFSRTDIAWYSSSTGMRNGKLVTEAPTINNRDFFVETTERSSSLHEHKESESASSLHEHQEFQTFKKAKYFIEKRLSQPTKVYKQSKQCDASGFMKANVYPAKGSQVYALDDIKRIGEDGFRCNKRNPHFRLYPCYKDKNDRSSERWVAFYKKKDVIKTFREPKAHKKK